uniref:Zinc metalloproteinase C607.06c n=1 Tax=Dermatophagoides pteronyssinus TaxID=6956 RepID=A0A6P6YB43_DERPT|nr:putative zinc metalloproteinase C607.06c [Dermatophagoides pteronyssinus]
MDVCVPLNPENKKFLRLIYLICQSGDDADDDKNWFDNGRFEAPENESNTIESGCQRISLAAMMVQYFYWKTTGKTFRLEFDQQERKEENRRPIVYRFLIKDHDHHKLWQMNQIDLWRLIANQLMNSTLATNDCKYLAFCSFSRFASKSNQPIWLPSKQVNGYVSLGGDGLALLSTHCLYCWPETIDEINERFEDQRPVDVDRFMNDSNNRNTRSGCLATTFGAVVHELGHVFGLAHRSTGIMSDEFNFIDEFFRKNNHHSNVCRRWWTEEDLTILNLNPWFDPCLSADDNENVFNIITTDNRKILQSKYDIRLLEYRHIDTNLVKKSKIFNKSSIKSIQINWIDKQSKLYILDCNGNSKTFYL